MEFNSLLALLSLL